MTALADYFREQADWRRQKASEYPEDARNLQSAEALEDLAAYVQPDENGDIDANVVDVEALGPFIDEHSGSLGGEETAREVSRYGFGYRVGVLQHDEFLGDLFVTCLQDTYEGASNSDPANDPTGLDPGSR